VFAKCFAVVLIEATVAIGTCTVERGVGTRQDFLGVIFCLDFDNAARGDALRKCVRSAQ